MVFGADSAQGSMLFRLYPNPVLRGQTFNIEVGKDSASSVRVSVFSAAGNLISTAMYTISKGSSRINIMTDTRWAAGVYFIRTQDEKGNIKQGKIIIQ
jgi:hypothetical protein